MANETSELPKVALELGEIFHKADYELALVGGSVRDLLLKNPYVDLDFTTNAQPAEIKRLLKNYLDDLWQVGERFGTIGGRKIVDQAKTKTKKTKGVEPKTPANKETPNSTSVNPILNNHLTKLTHSPQPSNLLSEVIVEVTTYRSDDYNPKSRKPTVKFGDSLEEDLLRRDFTINAMAITLPAPRLVDPYDGVNDLANTIIRTPSSPEKSFSDDPLRMLRAIRFVSQLGFTVHPSVLKAIVNMKERLEIISRERIGQEFAKLMMGDHVIIALRLLVDTGLSEYIIPGLERLKMDIDPAHHHKDVYEHTLKVVQNTVDMGGDFTSRIAALLHDIAKPQTKAIDPQSGKVSFLHHDVIGSKISKRILQNLKYDNNIIEHVQRLVFLHLRFYGYKDSNWTDAAVRRYIVDAGDQLERLHILVKSDCTTQNQHKLASLIKAYDELMWRIEELQKQEQLDAVRPALNGDEIMQILKLKPGPKVGQAYKYLMEIRFKRGEISKKEATELLIQWAGTKE
jgi:poly(A) polymerase